MQLAEMIAIEVMDAIEHHRRINKDDLITAAEVAISRHRKQVEKDNPLVAMPEVAAVPQPAMVWITTDREGGIRTVPGPITVDSSEDIVRSLVTGVNSNSPWISNTVLPAGTVTTVGKIGLTSDVVIQDGTPRDWMKV